MSQSLDIRMAQLDDTHAIGDLFRSRISVWQRINADGQVESIPYQDLTIYERWLHGGSWMSIETSTLFLSHLIRGAGIAVVAVRSDAIVGYAEAYPGSEPDPYGVHLHIAQMVTTPPDDQTIKDALYEYLADVAKKYKFKRLTVAFSSYDNDSLAYYRRHAMRKVERVVSYTITAQPGQTFYKTMRHTNTDPDEIEGWSMIIGRTESARYHWEHLWTRLWDAVEPIAKRRTYRLHINAAGHEALLCCQEQLYDPRSADIYCWSAKPLAMQLLSAIRDWAHRQDYRSLVFAVPEATVKVLGTDAESNPHQQDIYAVDIE